MSANVRPMSIRLVGQYLVNYGPLFQKENIIFDVSLLTGTNAHVQIEVKNDTSDASIDDAEGPITGVEADIDDRNDSNKTKRICS